MSNGLKEKVLQAFAEKLGNQEGVKCFFAPGRVNLIGEHTDYNGGHVFPCALSLGTYAAVKVRKDRKLRFYSTNFAAEGVLESSLDELIPGKESKWTNYPKGVMWAFEQKGYKLPYGMDVAISGDIPNGAGLSSSASLEVLTGYFLRYFFGFAKLTNIDLALIGQLAENQYCGMHCGIMDQFASAMGKKDNAIFLDTNTLNFEYVPLVLKGMKILVTNTNKKHSLVDSEYNLRRKQCAEALSDLQKVVQVKTLGDLSIEEFEKNKGAIKDPVEVRRAKHAVYENQRTIQAVAALKRNDVAEFGRLMNQSHVSLRDDYETSCKEADVLAEEAWKIKGVIGSRITGGGFGGCTVSIVKDETVDYFISHIGKVYQERTGLKADFYILDIGNGPSEI
jgi:galactokinase